MRHWIGITLAVAMAAALFFAGAWGYLRLLRFATPAAQNLQLPAAGGSLTADHSVLISLAAIAGTGLLAGILVAVPRISPLAAGIPGLLLLGLTGLYLFNVHRAVSLIPLRADTFGTGFEAMLYNGILGTLGIVMIIPMFVPSRWRTRRISPDDAAETDESDEFITMLGGSGPGDTTVPRGGRVPTAADLPSSFTLRRTD